MTLYEINKGIEDALNAIFGSMDEETGEVDEACVHELENLQLQKEEKLDNLGAFYKNLIAEAAMLKAEEQALKARRESKEKRAESLKNYIASQLNGEKFESARWVTAYRKSESVIVDDPAKLPVKFIRTKTVTEPDKVEIKKAIKAGQEVAGVHIVENNNMSIK